MIGGSRDRLRARFADQFMSTATGWVYRRGGRGPALPVGVEDHAMLIAGFDRATKWSAWIGVPVAALIWGVLDWRDLHPSGWLVAIPFVLICGACLWWAWLAPARLLEGRAPVAPALSGAQFRRNNLRTLPWSLLAVSALVSIAAVSLTALDSDAWSADKAGYSAVSIASLVVIMVVAVAKRRAG